jgi:conjugal transfer pilus assembly protein TraE
MNLHSFGRTWDRALRTNLLLGLLAISQMAAVIVLTLSFVDSKTRVVLVPPNLTTQARVGYVTASGNYLKAWGLYLAEMIGNITPANADFTIKSIHRLFSADIYVATERQIAQYAGSERKTGIVSFYHAHEIRWQPATKTVFVTGDMVTTTADGSTSGRVEETFQFGMQVVDGQPVVTHFLAYHGPAHTLHWIEANQAAKPPAPAQNQ